MPRKLFRRVALTGLTGLALAIACTGYLLYASLPVLDGVVALEGLGAPVQVELDGYGVPRIEAHTRADAFRALGFVTARDRLFQMDLLRRSSAGRLAEIFGPELLESDRWHRTMGFEHLVGKILSSLPSDQQEILRAYAQGVSSALEETRVLPFEFLMLGYRPSPWVPEDSLLVVMGLYETLSGSGDEERMVSVMEAALPPRVVSFLTPEGDCYTERLAEPPPADCHPRPLPAEDLRTLANENGARPPSVASAVRARMMNRGSSAWVVASRKGKDGRTLLANDMHMELSVPNIWYRAELHYGDHRVAGFTLPGLPLVIGGTNDRIAWGFTNVDGGDIADLVLLRVDPAHKNLYLTPQGPKPFTERMEKIQVRGAQEVSHRVRDTVWGPVLPEALLGQQVAVRWTALDPSATNLDLLDLDRVGKVDGALKILNRAGGPLLNALVADNAGNIGWTLSGRIPARIGFDGLMSRSWDDGARRWEGYIAPLDHPRLMNPPSGFLVNANEKMANVEPRFVVGHDYASGFRAYRIAERFRELRAVTERDMLDLQLDTKSDYYRYYQQLALRALDARGASGDTDLLAVRRYLDAWDGRAEKGSLGIALLVELRSVLADAVLTPLFERCRAIDPKFKYWWGTLDAPLQQLLDARLPELIPNRQAYADWDAFIVAMVEKSARNLLQQYPVESLQDLSWGQVNFVEILHPLASAVSLLGDWLNMPLESVPGCDMCVRWQSIRGGATERLVVSPGHAQDGILHMPGGQSGHPLSPFYRDQQANWVEGRPTDLLVGDTQHRLKLGPLDPRSR
ncbi:MAG: penicillin acylase family protein [Gammaproteobacteria bacterium]